MSTFSLEGLPRRMRGRLLARAARQGKIHIEAPTGAQKVVAHRLEAALRGAVAGEVRFDAGTRALYATDASNYRQVPIGVVIPRTVEDVLAALEVCRQHGAPVLARGGGTSLAGQCCNVAVVFDFSKYLGEVLEIDAPNARARVQPGCVLNSLNRAALKYQLRFGPDPSTHNRCTLGGMIGNNACGVHSVMAGRTSQNIESLDLVTYRGLRMTVGRTMTEEQLRRLDGTDEPSRILQRLISLRDRHAALLRERFPHTPRRSSGFALDNLLPERGFNLAASMVGTEGTCALVLEATVALVEWPRARALLALGYPDVYAAADDVPRALAFGPMGLEGMDDVLVEDMKKKGLHAEHVRFLPEGAGWLLVEFGGETKQEADAKAKRLMAALRTGASPPAMRLFDDPEVEEKLWKMREAGLGATAFRPGEEDAWEGWEDSAVPPERLGDYLREFRGLLDRHGYRSAMYGHFGDGCLHCRINFDLLTDDGIRKYRAFVEEAADLVVKFHGSLSGEHGDGQSRGELLPKMYGRELVDAFREFKRIWDPDGKMNPGKVVEPYRLDENLRLGTDYRPADPPTHFRFPADEGSFARAALRCVGVGECRKVEGGTMCPSYMVTREEKHSTRGRAHLLFEMLQGKALKRGWKEESVKEALDLCLACKACKSECPVNVDMATYKAEFLAHYYEGRLRPVSAYAMGLIDLWAHVASKAPRWANLLTQSSGLSRMAKGLANIAPERSLPKFAPVTFQSWHRSRPRAGGERPVILWPDTFNNHFHPDVAKAAVEVLERAGSDVVVPEQRLCCGRPLYDFGMLDRAKRLLERTIDVLRPWIREGVPIVVLEPSCAAVFRDELRNLLPHDSDAQRLSRSVFLLSEYLTKKAPDFVPPPLPWKALVQGHCHHKAVLGFDQDETLLEQLGLDVEVMDAGCCGMAGSFGYEKHHYDVSMKAGERVLLPKVRAASPETLVIADGFSCRNQLEHGTRRRGLHLAQVLQLAFRRGADGPAPALPENLPELHELERARPPRWPSIASAGLVIAALGSLALLLKGRHSR